MNHKQILKHYWGFDSFRPLQEDIILSVLNGNDTLALMPTGGGKSICFQVPAMAREGICIVVSPLIALMKDQVATLVKKNIKAVAVYSGMNPAEIDIAIDNCVFGDVKFLYLSPERLTTEIIRTRINRMKVNLLAVDEAHCISQWGYDFRPPYLQIAEIREFLPNTPILALTATATRDVIKDICQKLNMKKEKVFIKSFERKNLAYVVLKEENKNERLLKICRNVPGTGIVYVRNRKKCKDISDFLRKNSISADYYHAGLDSRLRDQKQKEWTTDKTRVIVCTNAFGMGIDKASVRFVVHLDLPDSPEAYYQEAGRAGRDEKKAFAVLLYNQSDLLDQEKFLEASFPPIEFIKNAYNALGNYYQLATGSGRDKSVDFILSDFCNHYNLDRITTFNALKFLEKEGYIMMSDAFNNPSKLMILISNDELYRYMVANKASENIIKTILRSYTGIFSAFIKIDENDLARRMNTPTVEVRNALKKLHQLRILHYEPQNTSPRITFIDGRVDSRFINISPVNYAERKSFALKRAKAISDYVCTSSLCRSMFLLSYFGEKNTQPCGHCDICLEKKKTGVTSDEIQQMELHIRQLLLDKEMDIKELVNSLVFNIPDSKKLSIIQWLLEHHKIIKGTSEGKLTWNNLSA